MNAEEPGSDEAIRDGDEEHASWAAYFGAATGLVVGLMAAMLGAAWLYAARPDTTWAEVFWEVASPLLAILGFVTCGYFFHRWFRGQLVVPAIIFLFLFALGAYLAAGPVGFPWKEMPAA